MSDEPQQEQQSPRKVTRKERNTALYAHIQSGKPGYAQALEYLTVENLPLVVFLVDVFLRTSPNKRYLRDDLIGDANLRYVDAVNALSRPHKQVKNLQKYLKNAIKYSLIQTCDRAELIGPSHRQRCIDREDGVASTIPIRESINLDQRQAEESAGMIDTLDALLQCCQNDIELQVIRLRADGLSVATIAEQLDISTATVKRLRRQVRNRFDAQEHAILA